MREIILSLGIVAVVTAFAALLAGEGVFEKLIRLIGGVLSALIIFNALTGGPGLGAIAERFSTNLENSKKTADREAQRLIQLSFDAYISSRARELGLSCSVRTLFDEAGEPNGVVVYYETRPPIEKLNELMEIISDELGIPPEAQRHAIEGS